MRLARALVAEFQRRRQGNTLLVTCKQGELEAALQADTTLADLDIDNWDVALSAALLYLDANEVLHLARGKAVFRSAMNIELKAEARRRQFKKSDYAELALHYKDKTVQVHVMAEYAKLAIRKVQAAMAFIVDYFSLDRADFVRRYFAGRKDVLEMATTEAAHRRILTALANPEQQAIVAAPLEGNHLVLAGPGRRQDAGDRASRRLAAAREHGAARCHHGARLQPRGRQRDPPPPVGAGRADAAGVTVQTLHGLAMRLTGTSYAVALERGEAVDFGAVIRGNAVSARGRKSRGWGRGDGCARAASA
jgi:ATP-dependent DNA helicase RecQ